MNRSLPTRQLREQPDLDQLKRQAKELLETFRSGSAAAIAEIQAHYRDADPRSFALHDAQLVLARAYGFDSWPKLKAYVDGITVERFEEAARLGAASMVRSMLQRRPELVNSAAILHAVTRRDAEMVRLLVERGANPRVGVYPHRDATTALAIARDRGYDEIVAIITAEEQRRREQSSGVSGTPDATDLFRAIATGANDTAVAMIETNPALFHARHSEHGWTPLHVAAGQNNLAMLEWLLAKGADPNARARVWTEQTPLDVAARSLTAAEFGPMAAALLKGGAGITPWSAVALGDAAWLQARHAEGRLVNPIEGDGGMLRIAAAHNQMAILQLLIDFGFDVNERTRMEDTDADDIAFTWGMPLYHCAQSGKYELAEMLLKAGADPNGKVYASGDPMFQAYDKRDWRMVELLQRYGGVPEATTAGLFRQTELARRMLAGETRYGSEGVGGDTLAEQLLWGGACGGDPEIVRMALEHIDRKRDDPWWFHIMEQPIRMWSDGGDQLACLKLIVQRCDPNIQGRESFKLTILHSIAGARPHVTPAQRVAFATVMLDAGARTDVRDGLLNSTPLGWACRWGVTELVQLLLERGAGPVEPDAEPWATPAAWAEKMSHLAVLQLLKAAAGT